MTIKLTPEQIEAAAEWWANAVCRPKFDNGDDSPAGGMAFALATLATKPVTPEARKVFKERLSAILAELNCQSLYADYQPEWAIANAMEQAGIHRTNCPWKTSMHLIRGGVQVSAGYRAPYVTLLAATSKSPSEINFESHVVYKDGDTDIPDSLKDRNEQVALRQCRNCGAGEIELYETRCPKSTGV